MTTKPPTIRIELTAEEAAVLAPLLEDAAALTHERRVAQLALRVAARVASQLDDLHAVRDRFLAERRLREGRQHECPVHRRPLRLDRSSLATLMRVYYCPVSGCDYVMEAQP